MVLHFLGPNEEPALNVRHLRAHPLEFDGLGQELFAEIGMGDGYEGHGPFLHALAVEIGDAVLGDHVVHVAAGGDHPGPGRERTPRSATPAPFSAVDGRAMMARPPSERPAPG